MEKHFTPTTEPHIIEEGVACLITFDRDEGSLHKYLSDEIHTYINSILENKSNISNADKHVCAGGYYGGIGTPANVWKKNVNKPHVTKTEIDDNLLRTIDVSTLDPTSDEYKKSEHLGKHIGEAR